MPKKSQRKKIRRILSCPKYLTESRLVKSCDNHIWEKVQKKFNPKNVFMNVPYIDEYKKIRHTIRAILNHLGLNPIMASERSTGDMRLCKICELIQSCKYGISDISYDSLHNIPFELGLLVGLGKHATSLILIDEQYLGKKRKFDSRLSNLKGVEIIIHNNNQEMLIRKLLERIITDIDEVNISERRKNTYIEESIKPIKSLVKVYEKLYDQKYTYSAIEGLEGHLLKKFEKEIKSG